MVTSYPPIHHHSTTRISQPKALNFLSAYLEAANTDPSLHPNAMLTQKGPATPSAGPNTGLVLHNLNRIEAGLGGEHLGADLTFQNYGGEGQPDMMVGNTIAGANEIPIGGLDRQGQELEGGWQDKEEFEREQEIVEGEIGKRDNAINGASGEKGGRVPKVEATKCRDDKKARKQAKKDKRKGERAAKEGAVRKKREKSAEG